MLEKKINILELIITGSRKQDQMRRHISSLILKKKKTLQFQNLVRYEFLNFKPM